jgi:hypothetical protein
VDMDFPKRLTKILPHTAMYINSAAKWSFGVHPSVYGIDTFFLPWFFTGFVVYWGDPCSNSESALKLAEQMMTIFRNGNT